LESLLEWQVSSSDTGEAKELSQFLQENRDRYKKQVDYLQRAVAEKRMRPSESDLSRRIGAWLAARRAVDKIVKETVLRALLERVRVNYRNKRDGTAIEIPEVDVQGFTRDLINQQEDKLREIACAIQTDVSKTVQLSGE